MTVVLLVVAGVSTVVVLACETLMEQRQRRRWVGWLGAAIALYVAVDMVSFRVAAIPWLLWLVTVVMVLVGIWRVTQLRRFRAREHRSLDRP